jgi:hypothetical protein
VLTGHAVHSDHLVWFYIIVMVVSLLGKSLLLKWQNLRFYSCGHFHEGEEDSEVI